MMVAPNDHEYHCYPAQNASHNPTKTLAGNANAGLLIFIRYEKRELVDPNVHMNADLELRSAEGEVITRFEEDDLYHDNNDKNALSARWLPELLHQSPGWTVLPGVLGRAETPDAAVPF